MARKWRPQKFEDVTGQEVLVRHKRQRISSRVFVLPTVAILASVVSILSANGQSPMPAPPFGPTHIGGPEPNPEDQYSRGRGDPTPRRPYGPSKEDRVLKKGLLAPTAQDRKDNAAFLNRFDGGLVRLLPREIFDWRTYHTEKRLNVRGGGAYYSFFYLSHEYGYGSDIEFDHNTLSVSFGDGHYGMLTNLGNVALGEISAHEPRAAFMSSYEPARNDPDERCEIKRFRNGVTIDGMLYKASLPVQLNSTYLLRSINYGRSDLLVRFRVVRQESDGSVILVWKLLQEYGRPGFERVLNINPIDKCPIKS